MDTHRMTTRSADELVRPGELQLHRPAGTEHGERDDVLDEHFLLTAEPAAHPAGAHPNPVPFHTE